MPSGKQLPKEQRSLQGHCSIRGQGTALHWHDRKHFHDKIYTDMHKASFKHSSSRESLKYKISPTKKHLKYLIDIRIQKKKKIMHI